jgi:mono/diheme cytochrome c family protein
MGWQAYVTFKRTHDRPTTQKRLTGDFLNQIRKLWYHPWLRRSLARQVHLAAKRTILRIGLAVLCLAGMSMAQEVAAPTAAPADSPVQAATLFSKYCYSCHGEGEKSGQIALDEMLKLDPATTHRREWTKAWRIVRQEFMPPVGNDMPSIEERKEITQWIEKNALGVDYSNPDPGRVTSRRLSRYEYEFSVTDLFGVNITSSGQFSLDNKGVNAQNKPLRDRLPPDDSAFGFDNNGDFQTISPALLDRYLFLAEWIVDQIIQQDGPRHPIYELTDPRPKYKTDKETRVAEMGGTVELAHDGPYTLETKFSVGEFAEISGVFEMLLLVDGQPVRRAEIEIGGHATHQFADELKLTKGKHTWAFVTRPLDELARRMKTLRERDGKLNVMNPTLHARLTGPVGTGVYEYTESHKRIFFNGEASGDPGQRRAYTKEILKRIADRAFRRPVNESVLERLADIAMSNQNFERGVGQAITAILVSPRFLFRTELQPTPDDPKAIHPIDEFALASRLSYLLWLSIPDDELRDLAAAGKLKENLEPQLKRMLADKKSARFFEDFPGQWLRTRNVLMTPNSRQGGILDPLRTHMKRETEMFFEHICKNDRDLLELITADYTFVNKPLAEFYNLPEVEEDKWQKVALAPESHRGGILTQASFLVSTSNPNRTSPVKRGLYVLDTFWAVQPPPPQPNVPSLEDAKKDGVTPRTVREQLAVHREDPACASCHAHFDPMGVALENYDLIGRWRDAEMGQKIEPKEETVTGEVLTGVEDIRKMFASRPDRFYRGMTEKLVTYALGRALEPYDAVTIDRIADDVMRNEGKFSAMLLGIAQSPQFQLRRGDDGRAVEQPVVVKQAAPSREQFAEQQRRRRAERQARFAGAGQQAQQSPPATSPATTSPARP